MDDNTLIEMWNKGSTRLEVAKKYMKENNKKAKEKKEMKRITIQEALQYVEPVLFNYRMNQLKGEQTKI